MSQKSAKKKRAEEDDPDKAKQDELKDALDKLTPEQAEMFVEALELAMRKRRLLLFGYIAALIGVVVGFGVALAIYGTREPGQFVGWIFLLPIALAGGLLTLFGKLARRLKKVKL